MVINYFNDLNNNNNLFVQLLSELYSTLSLVAILMIINNNFIGHNCGVFCGLKSRITG